MPESVCRADGVPLEGGGEHMYDRWDGYSLAVFFKEAW